MSSSMEGISSTLEDSAVSADSSSYKHPPFHPPHAPLLPLQRMGSGSSVVLDDEHEQFRHDAAHQHTTFRGRATLINVAESRKLPSSQYKGVVPQPNGRWGAQIYEKHHRIWLGTFDSKVEAARAYDVAASKFRGRDATTNLAAINDESELEFIGSRSKAEIVDMLRKHTYNDELSQSKRSCGPHKRKISCSMTGAGREHLFEKIVTPSDVGKLNRLVIPKQYAEKHFPLETGSLLLSFEDECGKVWRFRYSYWNSSQSYVLTKGWSRFVKEKGLKAGGAVIFQRSMGTEKQLYIECKIGVDMIKPVQMIRLFGVNISEVPAIKRKEMEFLPVAKKQCVRDQHYAHLD